LVVHGIYNTITDDGIIIELHRGKNRNARHFSDTELQRLSDDILAAERALHAVVVKYYLDAASIARNTRSAASDSDSESRS
jgi:hypothetical protein